MHEQFDSRRGWTEALRDERVAELADIAASYAQVRVTAWIRNQDWSRYIASLPAVARRFSVDNPAVMLVEQLILAVAVFGTTHGIHEPCDYYFDENEAVSAEMHAHWPIFKWLVEHSPRGELARFVGSIPAFKDEKDFLPLQASDLYASLARQHIMRNKVLLVPPSITLQKFARVGHIVREYSTAEIQRLRDHLIGVGEQFAKEYPHISLVAPIKGKRQRKKAHKIGRATMPKPPFSGQSS